MVELPIRNRKGEVIAHVKVDDELAAAAAASNWRAKHMPFSQDAAA